jgi:hypothetical protein
MARSLRLRLNAPANRHHAAIILRSGQEVSPVRHQPRPPLEKVAAPVSGFHLVPKRVRPRRLGDFPRSRVYLGRPVAERCCGGRRGSPGACRRSGERYHHPIGLIGAEAVITKGGAHRVCHVGRRGVGVVPRRHPNV